MDQRADRCRAFHGVGQPHVERELRRLAHGSQQQQDGRGGGDAAAQLAGVGGGEGIGHAEAAHIDPQEQDAHQQPDVADAGHHESLLRGLSGAGVFEPEPDQQVGAQAHQLPRDVQQQEVVSQRQGQHRRHEQGLPGKVPAEARIALHVLQRIQLDAQGDEGDQTQEHHRQRVDDDAPTEVNGVGDDFARNAGIEPYGAEVTGQCSGDAADLARRVGSGRAQEAHRCQRPHHETGADGQDRQRRAAQRQPSLEQDDQRAGGEGEDWDQECQRHITT